MSKIGSTYHRRLCDLTDCFAIRNGRCTLLDEAIYYDCPFYKVGRIDIDRYANIKSYRYAVSRMKELEQTVQKKYEEFAEAEQELAEAEQRLKMKRGELARSNIELNRAIREKEVIKHKVKRRMFLKLDRS